MEEKLEAKEEWIPAEDFNTGLTADDWKEILEDNDFIKKHPAGSIALWLYYDNRDDTPLSYTGLAEKYGIYDGYYKGGMSGQRGFNKALFEKFKEKIRQYTDEKGNNGYWYLSFTGRKATKEEPGSFIFKLRKEVRDSFDKLSEERRQMFNEMYQHKKEEYAKNLRPNIWVISAGDNANEWANFISEPAKMAIGWPVLGDLTGKTDEEIKKKFHEFYSDPNHKSLPSIRNFITAKTGDFVFARNGQKLLGFGRVIGDYKYDSDAPEYRHTFPVEWIKTDLESLLIRSYRGEVFTELSKKDLENQDIKKIMQEYLTLGTEIDETVSESENEKVKNTSSEKHDNTLNLIEKSSLNTTEKKWAKMLVNSHQIILTGAPGTGKTYAARKIAETLTGETAERIGEDDCRIGFVQFHPSMDYTDFVEGLRPVKGNDDKIGFERQDGIFKRFCANAANNWSIAQLSPEQQKRQHSIENDFNDFIETAEDTDHKFTLKKQNFFTITGKVENKLILDTPHTKNKEWPIRIDRILEAYSHFYLEKNAELLKTGRQIENYLFKSNNAEANYILPILQDFHRFRIDKKETKDTPDTPKEEPKNYVFIIDEINRGDIAKIFGELFFAIDPSYRGIKGKITTQYQALVDLPPFDNGFYIPENVYIIGTMNDIDRGVESMDFAIRRRFTWIEVDPKDTQDMLNSLNEKIEAENKMNALNAVVSKIIGLAYQIGAAYFMKLKHDELNGDFDDLWKYHLEPLLREYLRGEPAEEKITKMKIAYYDHKNEYDEKLKDVKTCEKFDEIWKELIKAKQTKASPEQGSSDSAEPEKQ